MGNSAFAIRSKNMLEKSVRLVAVGYRFSSFTFGLPEEISFQSATHKGGPSREGRTARRV